MTDDLRDRLIAASPQLHRHTKSIPRHALGRGVVFLLGLLVGFSLARITVLINF